MREKLHGIIATMTRKNKHKLMDHCSVVIQSV